MTRKIVVLLFVLLLGSTGQCFARDLNDYGDSLRQNWMKRAAAGRASLHIPELYRGENDKPQERPQSQALAEQRPALWTNNALSLGLPLDIALLVGDMSEKDSRRTGEKPQVVLIGRAIIGILSLLPLAPESGTLVPESIRRKFRINIDIDATNAGTGVYVELKWKLW